MQCGRHFDFRHVNVLLLLCCDYHVVDIAPLLGLVKAINKAFNKKKINMYRSTRRGLEVDTGKISEARRGRQ